MPLYVIDGIPIDNTNLGSAGVWGGADAGDGISALNPDEVLSISVLKGVLLQLFMVLEPLTG